LRLEYPGAVYYVTARGNAGQEIFLDDEDREAFLETLGTVVVRFHWIVHAYCLMTNHYHLLVETPEANLSRGMRQLNGVTTQAFNRRHDRTGHVLEGRFKAILVEKESHLLGLARYVVLNPVRAKAVEHPRLWKWSSYRATSREARVPDFLTTDWILAQFSSKRELPQRGYRRFVAEGRGVAVWEDLRGGVLLGSDAFVKKLSRLLHGKAESKEIPQAQRRATRPSLAKLFQGKTSKAKRDQAIHEAVVRHGYTQSAIASYLRLHYSTVSRIVKQVDAARETPTEKT
jgi:REP element-mobilizing transposase RayT